VGVIVLSIVLVLSAATVGFSFVGDSQDTDRPKDGQMPSDVDTSGATVTQQSGSADPTTYRVTASNESALDQAVLRRYGSVGTQAGRHVEVTLSRANATRVADLPWVESVGPVQRPVEEATDSPATQVSAAASSQVATQSGAGVKVGVIDAGFDTTNDEISGQVAATRSFRETAGDTEHGTDVAEVVATIAPESELYLTATGSGIDTLAAIDYLRQQDVDVIVMSLGYLLDDDGENFLTQPITEARQDGVLFVTSAGNNAQKHWEGEFVSTDGNPLHEWAPNDELNCVPNCEESFEGGDIDILLEWSEDGDGSRYRVGLYNPVTEEVLDTSEYDERENVARLDATIQSQPVDIYVEHVAGPADDRIEVVTFSDARRFEHSTPGSSLGVPADVPEAVAVAAYENDREQLAPYSSRGPTDTGRQGVTITGLTNLPVSSGNFAGTSAAAPYVGGVAALVEDASGEDLSPDEVERVLTDTAIDIRAPGPDPASGAGLVNGTAAIDAVETASDTGLLSGQVSDPSGEAVDGVIVTVRNSSGTVARTSTDVAGGYTVELSPGEYTVRFDKDGFVTTSVTVTVESDATTVRDPVLERPDDRFEPNDQTTSATPLAPGSYTDLGISVGDRDVFVVELAAGEELTAGIDFAHDDGNLDLAAYDPSGDRLDLSNSTTDDEAVTVTADIAGTYYVQVYGYANAYDLELQVESRSPGAVEGQVVGPDGAPVSDATVRLENASGTALVTNVLENGSYRFPEVAPGEYTVVADAEGTSGRSNVTVAPGETVATDVVVPVATSPSGAEPSLRVSPAVERVAPGESFTVDYSVSNEGNASTTAGSLEITELPDGATVTGNTGETGSFAPSRNTVFFVSPIEPGEAVQVELRFAVAENASTGDAGFTTTLTFQDESGSNVVSERASVSVLTDSDPVAPYRGAGGEVTVTGVLDAIGDFNDDDIGIRTVLQAIEEYNG
jgi:hypothetical protein